MDDLIGASVFYQIAFLLVLAAAAGLVGLLLRQPLIVSFIAVGLAAGPSGLDVANADAQINLLAQLGIAVLLFLVGIKRDTHLIRSLGAVSLLTGLGQVAFTSVIGFGIGLATGLDPVTSLYIAVALTFSSTIIIVKLLSDKREIDSLHGQIALGFLIVQDFVVVLAMIVLSTVGIGTADEASAWDVVRTLLAGMGMVALILLFIRYGANPLTERLARAPELLICFALALAAACAAAGDALGFGKELGGLLAGIALASTPFREMIAARLAPLRDFLLLFFFIALGSTLDLRSLGSDIGTAVLFSLFVLVGNPLIVMAIMGAMGYRKRTGFLAGLTVAQISEFSLVFVAMGVTLGHVGTDALGLVTLVGIITIAASTYMITWSHRLYALCEPLLGAFERRVPSREPDMLDEPPPATTDFIVIGLGRYGRAIAERLSISGRTVLGVDFNPDAVRAWRQGGQPAEYGDATDPEFLATLPLRSARWVVATMPTLASGLTHDDPRKAIIQGLRGAGYRGRIAVSSRGTDGAAAARPRGADLCLDPFQDAADRATELLLERMEA